MAARIFVRTVSIHICSEGFSFLSSAVRGQRLNAFAGVQHVVDIALCQEYYMPSMHVLLSAKRNYKKIRQLSHLTIEEQFILRVSGYVVFAFKLFLIDSVCVCIFLLFQ